MIQVQELIEAARAYVATPWHHQGRHKLLGLDCVGFVEVVGREIGAIGPEVKVPADYGRTVRPGALREFVSRFCIETPKAIAGTLLLLRMPYRVCHVALCTGDTLIHCAAPNGVIEQGYRHPLRARTESAWLIPNVAYDPD